MSDPESPLRTAVDAPHDSVVTAVREALRRSGFGVLTEIDLAATLRRRLGPGPADGLEPFLLLGVCRADLALEALLIDPTAGTTLPCTVVVRGAHGRTVVEVADPRAMVELTGNLALAPVAGRAHTALVAAVHELRTGPLSTSARGHSAPAWTPGP